jgi:hypothetical protein
MIRRIAWVAATCVGLSIGGFIFHFPGSFGEVFPDPAALIFGAILGFITGIAVGLIQWAALFLPRGPGGRLVVAMGVGIGVTHALNDGVSASYGLVALSIASGLGMAGSFAAILGERRPVAVTACFIGWAGGLLVADAVTNALHMPWSETPVGWSMEHAVAGLVVGVLWGGLTAAVGLPAMLQRGAAPGAVLPTASQAGDAG